MNASIWLGAVCFFSFAARPASLSPEMAALLGAKNYPFYSGAIEQIAAGYFLIFISICAVIALVHLLAEWLYMGRPTRKTSMLLLAGLLGLVLINGVWLQPKIKGSHAVRYAPNIQPGLRESAARSYHFWEIGAQCVNALMLAGLVVYVWRVAHPSDAPRFISSVKFRG